MNTTTTPVRSLIDQYYQQLPHTQLPDHPPSSSSIHQSMGSLNNNNDVIYEYQQNMRDYHLNMRSYQQNMNIYINNLQRDNTPNTPSRMFNNRSHVYPQSDIQPNRDSHNSLYSIITGNPYTSLNTDNVNENEQSIPMIIQDFTDMLRDVLISPTQSEINNATELIQFSSSDVHNMCPITLDRFIENENVCRIKNCGHIFKIGSLNEWFRSSVKCPVCRYDIRTYVNPQSLTTLPIQTPYNPYQDESYDSEQVDDDTLDDDTIDDDTIDDDTIDDIKT
jgi:hypothetical protein